MHKWSHLLFDLKYSAQKDIVATIHKEHNTSQPYPSKLLIGIAIKDLYRRITTLSVPMEAKSNVRFLTDGNLVGLVFSNTNCEATRLYEITQNCDGSSLITD
jgi:hypothetical protein